MDDETRYRALCANDPRFDGLFFVGIRTTGIYCRSLCPARRARRKNCTFYVSAAAAEESGYRPCLRCRPELAPAQSPYAGKADKAAALIAQIQGGALNGEQSLEDLAARHALSVRQVRRVVKLAAGVSPVQLAQTARLLLAKQLLTESDLSVTEIAFASGFASLRRFNELFAKSYRMPPGRFRRVPRRPRSGAPEWLPSENTDASLQLHLSYRPPLAWDALLAFLAPRTIAGVDAVDGGRYRRTLRIGEHGGHLQAELADSGDQLLIRVSAGLTPVLQPLLALVRDQFDLHAQPSQVDAHLAESKRLAPLVQRRPGLRVPGTMNGFELAWRAVLGQQVSVAGATTLAGRFAARFGEPTESSQPGLSLFTPSAERVAQASAKQVAAIGIPSKRAASIAALAKLCAREPNLLSPGASPGRVRAELQELPGIGPWTAEYIVLRALHWPDAFPASDLALKRALETGSPRDCLERASVWSPWRSYAALHLWTELANQHR